MREVAAFEGAVAAAPDAVFARLRQLLTADGALRIVRDDLDARELRGEGAWWFHGRWTVEPEGRGSRVVLRVYNKLDGIEAFTSFLPERQAVRSLRAKWPDLLAELTRSS